MSLFYTPIGKRDAREIEHMTDMKLLVGSVVFGMKHAARVMKPPYQHQGVGSIINNASIAGHRFAQGSFLYAAAKAARPAPAARE